MDFSSIKLTLPFFQLMPSPKWKLVVDVGEPEPVHQVRHSQMNVSDVVSSNADVRNEDNDDSVLNGNVFLESTEDSGRDSRVQHVISLLGEYMPSDTSSPLASSLQGLMSLRLMLLRRSRSPEEEEMVSTILGSYSSYSAGGRTKDDIAVMLARDFMFLVRQQPSPQPQAQTQSFLGQSLSNNMMESDSCNMGYSFFGLGPTPSGPISSFHTSPSLAPIPMSGSINDSVSIVSM
jgi:hypothetical protein